MSFFGVFWFTYLVLIVVGRAVYDRHKDKDRQLIFEDKRFFQAFVIRPLFLIGEHFLRDGNREKDHAPLSILPPRPPVLPMKAISVIPKGAKLTIQHAGHAHRCEVCHQEDLFNAETGQCQRCDHRTL